MGHEHRMKGLVGCNDQELVLSLKNMFVLGSETVKTKPCRTPRHED
jgi:hypothetical protein